MGQVCSLQALLAGNCTETRRWGQSPRMPTILGQSMLLIYSMTALGAFENKRRPLFYLNELETSLIARRELVKVGETAEHWKTKYM